MGRGRVAVCAALLLLTGLVPAGGLLAEETAQGDRGLRDGQVTELVEGVIPEHLVLDGSHPADTVRILDDVTGYEVPLTGNRVRAEGGQSLLSIPQLPPGRFTVTWPDGTATVLVREYDGTEYEYISGSESEGFPYLALLPLALLPVALLLRRRRGAAVMTGTFALLASGGLLLLDGRQVENVSWEACNLEAASEAVLDCKVQGIIGLIERAEFEKVGELLGSNNDSVCHEVAHRASFHMWRVNRDLEQARRMLIPGCDDGLIHGIAESMATFSTDETFIGDLVSFCTSSSEPYQVRACLHGGGHATIWRTNGDLEKGWELCRTIPEDALPDLSAQQECMGSAIMEWSDRWSFQKRAGESLVRPVLNEPMELCLRGPETELFRLGCYLGTNHRTGDAAAAARWCNEREKALKSCYEAIGENLPYFELPRVEVPLSVEMAAKHAGRCAMTEESAARNACTRALTRVLVTMRVSKTLGAELCERIAPVQREACLGGLADAEERFRLRGIDLA